jgi:hypothetical protein
MSALVDCSNLSSPSYCHRQSCRVELYKTEKETLCLQGRGQRGIHEHWWLTVHARRKVEDTKSESSLFALSCSEFETAFCSTIQQTLLRQGASEGGSLDFEFDSHRPL